MGFNSKKRQALPSHLSRSFDSGLGPEKKDLHAKKKLRVLDIAEVKEIHEKQHEFKKKKRQGSYSRPLLPIPF